MLFLNCYKNALNAFFISKFFPELYLQTPIKQGRGQRERKGWVAVRRRRGEGRSGSEEMKRGRRGKRDSKATNSEDFMGLRSLNEVTYKWEEIRRRLRHCLTGMDSQLVTTGCSQFTVVTPT
jgi:hypothetical protein